MSVRISILSITSIITIITVVILLYFTIPHSGHASFEGGSINSTTLATDLKEIQLPQNECMKNQQFGPGPPPHFTGSAHWPWPSSDNITGIGFSKIMKVTDNKGNEIDNFVLEPGHDAKIQYSLFVKSDSFNPRNLVWISNDAGFIHRSFDKTITQTISDMGNMTLDNGTTKKTWYTCKSTSGEGTGCNLQYGQKPANTVSLQTLIFDHPGISVSYNLPFELVGIVPITVTATISASDDSPMGTYWMYLAPGPNDGGPEVLLTVGNCSK